MNTNVAYAKALGFALDHEGRLYEDVPGDPGGPTKWGVTWKDDNDYRREHGLPLLPRPSSVAGIGVGEIMDIYREHYWDPCHGDDLPAPLGFVLFDTSVNCGIGRAVVWLQKTLGVDVDGAFGPATLAAAQAYIAKHGVKTLASAILKRRVDYYNQIGDPGRELHKFLAGWLNRVNDLKVAAGLAQ